MLHRIGKFTVRQWDLDIGRLEKFEIIDQAPPSINEMESELDSFIMKSSDIEWVFALLESSNANV